LPKDYKFIIPKKIRRLKTAGNLNNSKLSCSLESVELSKKSKDRQLEAATRLNKSHVKSKLSGTAEKKKPSHGHYLNNSMNQNFNGSFEKRVFESYKTSKFDKSLMVNFKDFLKMHKSRDHTNIANL
jgi:hypothetical protein